MTELSRAEEKYGKEYFDLGIGSNYRCGVKFDEWTQNLLKHRLEILKKHISYPLNQVKILDIGCAKGFFLSLCDQESWQTFGVDISSYALSFAPQFTKAKFLKLDASREKLSYTNDFFEAVVFFDVIEHLEQDEFFLKEIKRVLKDKGTFMLVTPDGKSRWDKDITHINIYRKEDLISKLEKFGFEVMHTEEERGYSVRIIPLRRFAPLNFMNQRVCDLLGCYLKGLILAGQINKKLNSKL